MRGFFPSGPYLWRFSKVLAHTQFCSCTDFCAFLLCPNYSCFESTFSTKSLKKRWKEKSATCENLSKILTSGFIFCHEFEVACCIPLLISIGFATDITTNFPFYSLLKAFFPKSKPGMEKSLKDWHIWPPMSPNYIKALWFPKENSFLYTEVMVYYTYQVHLQFTKEIIHSDGKNLF